jgi:hypothetical protein
LVLDRLGARSLSAVGHVIQPLPVTRPKRRTVPLLPVGWCPCPRCGQAIELPATTNGPLLCCTCYGEIQGGGTRTMMTGPWPKRAREDTVELWSENG